MKTLQIFLILLCLVLSIPTSFADTEMNQDIDPKTGLPKVILTGTTYSELCKIDPVYCDSVLLPNKSVKNPKKTILVIFQRFRKKLKKIAELFDVDPRLIVAVITTEHTLNVDIVDVWQDILVRETSVARDGSVPGYGSVSYGFGQIYTWAAEAAEPIVAEFEDREQISQQEVVERLKTFEGALTYAAALIVNAKRVYNAEGFDISRHPGVLATLYNIGRVDERVQATIARGGKPRVNYFGWFVEYHWEKFNAVLVEDIATFRLTQEDYEAERIQAGKGLDDQVPVYSLREATPLFVAPQRCRDKDTGNAVLDRFKEVLDTQLKPKGEQGIGRFNILQESVDCRGNPWALARFSNGRLGWLRHNDVEDQMSFQYAPRACKQKNYDPCLNEIMDIVGEEDVLEFNPLDGIVSVKLKSFPNGSSVNYQRFFGSCYDADSRGRLRAKFLTRKQDIDAWIAEAQAKGYVSFREDLLDEPDDNDNLDTLHPSEYLYVPEEVAAIRRSIEILKTDLAKYPEFAINADRGRTSANPFRRILGWIDLFEMYCKPGRNCIGPKPHIISEFFAEVSAESLRDVATLFPLLEKYDATPLTRRDYIPRNSSFFRRNLQWTEDRFIPPNVSVRMLFGPGIDEKLEYYRLDDPMPLEQQRMIRDRCGYLLERVPELSTRLEAGFAKINKHSKQIYFGDLRFSRYQMLEIITYCEIFTQVLRATEAKQPIGRLKLSFPNGTFNLNLPKPFDADSIKIAGSRYSILGTRIEDIAYRQFTVAELESMVANISENFFESHQRFFDELDSNLDTIAKIPQILAGTYVPDKGRLKGGLPNEECAYDPIASIERIQSLLNLSCVAQVLVPPEENLIKEFAHPDRDGTVKVMPETDRFELTLKPNCEDEGRDGEILEGGLY